MAPHLPPDQHALIEIKEGAAREDEEEDEINESAESGEEIGSNLYQVVPGDTLFSIADRVYGDPRSFIFLANINNLQNPNLINPGALLIIPDQSVLPVSRASITSCGKAAAFSSALLASAPASEPISSAARSAPITASLANSPESPPIS